MTGRKPRGRVRRQLATLLTISATAACSHGTDTELTDASIAILYGRVSATNELPLSGTQVIVVHDSDRCGYCITQTLTQSTDASGRYRAQIIVPAVAADGTIRLRFAAEGFAPDSVIRRDVAFGLDRPLDSVKTNIQLRPR